LQAVPVKKSEKRKEKKKKKTIEKFSRCPGTLLVFVPKGMER